MTINVYGTKVSVLQYLHVDYNIDPQKECVVTFLTPHSNVQTYSPAVQNGIALISIFLFKKRSRVHVYTIINILGPAVW
jgi:hypothetical protein